MTDSSVPATGRRFLPIVLGVVALILFIFLIVGLVLFLVWRASAFNELCSTYPTDSAPVGQQFQRRSLFVNHSERYHGLATVVISKSGLYLSVFSGDCLVPWSEIAHKRGPYASLATKQKAFHDFQVKSSTQVIVLTLSKEVGQSILQSRFLPATRSPQLPPSPAQATSPLPFILLLILTLLTTIPIFIVGLFALISKILSSTSGWNQLAAQYSHRPKPTQNTPSTTHSSVSLYMGFTRYRNSIELGLSETGLFLRLSFFMFRWSHKDLLIPWTCFTSIKGPIAANPLSLSKSTPPKGSYQFNVTVSGTTHSLHFEGPISDQIIQSGFLDHCMPIVMD